MINDARLLSPSEFKNLWNGSPLISLAHPQSGKDIAPADLAFLCEAGLPSQFQVTPPVDDDGEVLVQGFTHTLIFERLAKPLEIYNDYIIIGTANYDVVEALIGIDYKNGNITHIDTEMDDRVTLINSSVASFASCLYVLQASMYDDTAQLSRQLRSLDVQAFDRGNLWKDFVEAIAEAEGEAKVSPEELLSAIESGNANQSNVSSLISKVFPAYPAQKITPATMTPLQSRAVQVLYPLLQRAASTGTRLFAGYMPCWGLPDTMREWQALATGTTPSPINHSLPLLARASAPAVPVQTSALAVGERVIHRFFGRGVVRSLEDGGSATIHFEEEGILVIAT
jgi:hypothetical protein